MDTCALACTSFMHKDGDEKVHSGQLHLVHSGHGVATVDRVQYTMFYTLLP